MQNYEGEIKKIVRPFRGTTPYLVKPSKIVGWPICQRPKENNKVMKFIHQLLF